MKQKREKYEKMMPAYVVMRRPAFVKRKTHEMARHGVFIQQSRGCCMRYKPFSWLKKYAVVHGCIADYSLYVVFS